MKKLNKIISMLLAALMLLSSLAVLFTVNVFAEDNTEAESATSTETGTEQESGTETGTEAPKKQSVDPIKTYFATPDEKIATMTPAYVNENGDVCLYVYPNSGEVAYVNPKTGEKLFTNPYDIASSTGNDATKFEILSQIIVTFTDSNGQERIFTSYEEAAKRGQIVIEKIKNGIRVEYTIGREQSKILVPRLISMERFEEMILQPLLEVFGDELYNPRSENTDVFDVQKALSYFMIYSVDKLDLSKSDRANLENTFGGLYDDLKNSDAQYARALKKFPIIETMPVYVFDPDASEKELTRAEEIIQKYCPEYTYEELEYDHILTEYKSDDANPPVFRMALEYKVDDDGLSVRLPANGIRFNESLYTLEHLQILPYMGAGNSAYEGYNFFPDGSGTLFDFQNLNTNQTRAVSGKVYGTDFAYHEISGTYQKTIRYPVFGIVEESVYYTYDEYKLNADEEYELVSTKEVAGNIIEAIKALQNGETVNFCNGQAQNLADNMYEIQGYTKDDTGAEIPYGPTFGELVKSGSSIIETKTVNKRGFVCIIEEGDALASLTTYHAGALSDYNTIKMQFTPRPKDSYNISDSISVGSNSEWTVVSDRKYVGNYSMKYITLSDAEKEAEKSESDKKENIYDASWFGMAAAYRAYLQREGILAPISEQETKLTSDIPLYIETFGAIETTEKIPVISVPITVMKPLTTFDNIIEMYKTLSNIDENGNKITENDPYGIRNINFKLTGYANGGMWYTMPGNLKFEKAVGGKDGFQKLLDTASKYNKNNNVNFGVFPDFDFAYMTNSGMFDGHSALKHNAQTIDGRYASKRVYSATQQKYENYYEMVISPAYFAEFYEKLTDNYKKYQNVMGISVSTLGSALNSDFDEDEPYNREDSKEFTVEAFGYFSENYSQVMTNSANAYTWKYVDHMLGVSLDSSRYNFASESVPFIGVVLHGSVRFAGEPLNMEGDLKYAMLKAIENGASPYFILSFDNTEVLKEDEVLSKYYSIRYDIWKDDIYDTYSVLNNVLGDVQDKYIIGHSFLSGGERIPDSDELDNDITSRYDTLLESYKNAAELLEKELERAASIARENGRLAEEYAANTVIEVMSLYNDQMGKINATALHDSTYYNNLDEAFEKFKDATELKDSTDPQKVYEYERIKGLYDIVKLHNISIGKFESAFNTEFNAYKAKLDLVSGSNGYKDHKTLVDKAYDNYAGEKIVLSQLRYSIIVEAAKLEISNAIDQFKNNKITKDELLSIINTYGPTCINLSEFDKRIFNYATGKITDDKFKEEIGKWFDKLAKNDEAKINAEIDSFAKDEKDSSKQKIIDAIAGYFASKLSKTEIDAKIDAMIVAKAAYTTAQEGFEAGTVLEADLNAAKNAYLATENAAAYAIIANISESDAEALYVDCMAKSDAYNVYLAANDAIEAVKTFGFNDKLEVNKSFEECYAVYYNLHSNQKFEDFHKLISKYPKTCSEEDKNAFYTFYYAEEAANELTSEMNAIEQEFAKKKFENYVGALVEYNWMKENQTLVTAEELVRQESLVKQTRGTAVNNIVKTGIFLTDEIGKIIGEDNLNKLIESTGALKDTTIASSTIKDIREKYETALEHVAKAEAAIDVLAKSENYEIKYNGTESLLNIDLDDQSMPFVVREAVNRAISTHYYIVEDMYMPDDGGYPTNWKDPINNKYTIYQSDENSDIYFYVSYEDGYQYLKMTGEKDDKGDPIFAVYDVGLSKEGEDKDGNLIYSHIDNAFGKGVYYTISGNKMTYYTKMATGVFVEKARTVYNGEKVAERDGVDIYRDGDVYYAVNEDGTYRHYTYTKSIANCYKEIIAANEDVMGVVDALQKNTDAKDSTILTDILNRMETNERVTNSKNSDDDVDAENENEASKYSTDNIVCVVYGDLDGNVSKTVILNYNNYAVKIEYEGVLYTIPAHYFVVHDKEGGKS